MRKPLHLFHTYILVGAHLFGPTRINGFSVVGISKAAIVSSSRVSSSSLQAEDITTSSLSLTSSTTNEATLRSVIFSNILKDQNPDLLCDLLMEIGACSTSITDADVNTDQEEPLYGEPSSTYDPWRETLQWAAPVWNRCNVTAHFPDGVDLKRVLRIVEDTFVDNEFGVLDPDVSILPNQDWVVKVQQSWKPIIIANRIVLRFPWHTSKDIAELVGPDSPVSDMVELELQGGVAFGTGEHATTQLCLEWIDQTIQSRLKSNTKDKLTVLDYGAGSGVLGMAACAMARDRVTAVGIDIDFDSCRIANANALQNKVNMQNYLPPLSESADKESMSLLLKAHAHAKGRLQERNESGSDIFLPISLEGKQYDVTVANILAGPLITLAPTLAGMTRAGGKLGLSGILPHQGEDVAEAYRRAGFEEVCVQKELNGWVLVTGTKSCI
jgi:ribosomal protein L11 methyltransferase